MSEKPSGFAEMKRCVRCAGTGELKYDVCSTCKGTGWLPMTDKEKEAAGQRTLPL